MALTQAAFLVPFVALIQLETVNLEPIETLNIILLTYPRSGSSFTGELISSHSNSAYFFEPSYLLFTDGAGSRSPETLLSETLTCNQTTLDALRNVTSIWIVRRLAGRTDVFKNSKYTSAQLANLCQANTTTTRVAKTIRFPLADAARMLEKGTVPNLKIVHLVRDPRARYNSMHMPNTPWSESTRSIAPMCGDMEADLRAAESLHPSKYHRVRYEDLVADPRAVAKEIYASVYGMPTLPAETDAYIQQHTGPKVNGGVHYYSTFRKSNFTPGHWEHDLNRTTVEGLQSHPACKYVLEKLNYPLKTYN